MTIPAYHELFPAFLKCLNDDKIHQINEITRFCSDEFALTEEDLTKTVSSGESLIRSRVGWARTYLKKAGLIENTSRGFFKLTELGKKAANDKKCVVDLKYLCQFESFRIFFNRNPQKSDGNSFVEDYKNQENDETPIEAISNAINKVNDNLADDLMNEILKLEPTDFEKLVIKLLIKMGYGSEELNVNAVTKASGDEGIDGCIIADRFGFDSIYTQAKKWKLNEVVGRPEIQKFLGALAGQGATKGLFITTSGFTKEAKSYAAKQLQYKIVLVDGKKLTDLMIEHNLGVQTVKTFEIKRIDSDFFNEEF